jgi:hypothetical protein
MSDTRTETARDHDDSDIIDQAVADSDPDAVASTSGGALAQDVGSQDELNAVDDPDGTTRATKHDDIDAGVAEPSNRARD